MYELLLGMVSMGSFVISLYFIRFWKITSDRFFLFFAVAFGIEAVNRFLLAVIDLPETYPIFYIIRLVSFSLILFALIDKNRPQSFR